MPVQSQDIFQVNWVGSCFNQRIMLTHHYRVESTAGLVDDLAASAALGVELTAGGGGDVMESAYRACLPPDYELIRVDVQKIKSTRYRKVSTVRGQAGTNANVAYQANVHAALQFVTDYAGRDQVSVKKIGPLPQHISLYDDGLLTATMVALLNTLATAMKTSINATAVSTTFQPVIFHRSGTPNFTVISGHIVQETVRVKTRRTVRVGE